MYLRAFKYYYAFAISCYTDGFCMFFRYQQECSFSMESSLVSSLTPQHGASLFHSTVHILCTVILNSDMYLIVYMFYVYVLHQNVKSTQPQFLEQNLIHTWHSMDICHRSGIINKGHLTSVHSEERLLVLKRLGKKLRRN